MLTDLGLPVLWKLYDLTFWTNTRLMTFERYLARWVELLNGDREEWVA